ncbi:MAG: hypothetical protein OEW04_02195 [Nitrospirota bacterium]|nr:hypothetical protein [Nitrospirota bacterium]
MNKNKMINSYWDRRRKGIYSSLFLLFCFYILIGVFGLAMRKAPVFASFLIILLIAMYGFYLIIDYIYFKKSFKKYGRIDYDLNQLHTMEIQCNKDDAFQYALTSIKTYKGIRDIEPDKQRGIIEAERKGYCKTRGENIKIIIKEGFGTSLIEIYSSPRFKRAFIDFAQNYENVEIISASIKNLMEMKKI